MEKLQDAIFNILVGGFFCLFCWTCHRVYVLETKVQLKTEMERIKMENLVEQLGKDFESLEKRVAALEKQSPKKPTKKAILEDLKVKNYRKSYQQIHQQVMPKGY